MPLLFWDLKRHRVFLLVLKDPIDLDKFNHCKCFLLTWLLFVVSVVCFHHLESWTFKQLSLVTLEMAVLQQRSDSDCSMEEHGLGPSGTQLVWANEIHCICMCRYALSSVAFLLLNLLQLLLHRTGDNSPLIHGTAQCLHEDHSSSWGQDEPFSSLLPAAGLIACPTGGRAGNLFVLMEGSSILP